MDSSKWSFSASILNCERANNDRNTLRPWMISAANSSVSLDSQACNGRLVASIVNQAGSFKTNIPSHGQAGNLNLSQAMLQPTCSNTLLWIYPYLCDSRGYNCVCVITSPSFAHFWANHHDGYTNSPYTIFMLIIGMLKILNSSITKLFLILWDILEACKPGQTI